MPLRFTHIAKRIRDDSLSSVAQEALLRISRKARLSRFEAEIERTPEVTYCPIGYYKPAIQIVPSEAQEKIVQFADFVLRGEFPLMGYGNVALGFPPDWSKDWVSGKTWSIAPAKSLAVVRHDGSDVKAPWELSRSSFFQYWPRRTVSRARRNIRARIRSLLSDWIERNPCDIGVNWTIAMEAALRAISICLTLELLWPLREDEQDLAAQGDFFSLAPFAVHRSAQRIFAFCSQQPLLK